MKKEIVFEKKGKTAYIILDRPEKGNTINLAMRQQLRNAWKEIDTDPNVRSVIVTGGEKVFSTGLDLVEVEEFRKREPIAELPLNSPDTFGAHTKKPVIAAISGYCLGAGLFLTLVAGDFRVASHTAIFGMPEVRAGIPPSLGIPPILARHFPPALAAEILLLGNNITAEDGYRCGYINRIVDAENLMPTAEEYAHRINSFSPLLVRNIKEVLKAATTPDPQTVAFSNAICRLGRHSEDYIEGLKAFREKRKPDWKGR